MTTPQSLTEERIEAAKELLRCVDDIQFASMGSLKSADLHSAQSRMRESLALSPDVLGDQKDKGKAAGKGSLTAPEASEELPSSEGSRVAVTLEGEFFVKHHDGGDKSDETWDEYRVDGEQVLNKIADAAGTYTFNDDLHEGGWELTYKLPVRITIERASA